MTSLHYHVGQRLSLRSQNCTVRYIGPVADKAGEWLGVEWDDAQRGKHNGSHAGVSYFQCRSGSPTAASFLRPSQPWDESRTFLQALKEKYAPETAVNENEVVHVSASKKIEEVGYEKLARRQAQLQGIRTIVLDRSCMRHDSQENGMISEMCEGVTNVDISGNLFETIDEILDLCRNLPKLASLALDCNRFTLTGGDIASSQIDRIRTLSLSSTLLDWDLEVTVLLKSCFGGLDSLVATNNEWASIGTYHHPLLVPPSLRLLDISNNEFTSLDDIKLSSEAHLTSLFIKNNHVERICTPSQGKDFMLPSWYNTVEEIDVRHNNISTWSFIDDFSMMPRLQHLRVTGNPLYQNHELSSEDTQKAGTDDSYMLTVARLPGLKTLNYSTITEKERLNAETYYLNKIAAEIRATPDQRDSIVEKHPRWTALCEAYGEPAIAAPEAITASKVNPKSLAARLINITFYTSQSKPQIWNERLPKSINTYSLLGVVARKLKEPPTKLRLIYETGESDPASQSGQGERNDGPDWWDSDDDETHQHGAHEAETMQWVAREVQLIPGTRSLGTYVENAKARVRVELT